jgi:hypothetical protein
MPRDAADPRSEAEKARADLKRNAEMGAAVTETPLTRQPSVTPDTFGVHDEAARVRSGGDQGVEAGGTIGERGPGDSKSVVESEQVATRRDTTAPTRRGDEHVLSRAKE